MNEIDTLTRAASDLGHSVDFWNRVLVWGLAFAAAAAIVAFISTRMVVFRQGRQAEAQSLLDAAKDRQLQSELAAQRAVAAVANQRAADANERAAHLEVEAEQLRKQQSAQQRRGTILMDQERRPEFRSHLLPSRVSPSTCSRAGSKKARSSTSL